MPARLRSILRALSDPGRLVAMAGLCVLVSLFAGYVSLHETADRVLALRQGPPPPVAVEAFRPGAHVGPAREVTVRAVADPDRVVTFQIAGDDGVRTVLVLPLFATTAQAPGAAPDVPAFVFVDGTARGARPDIGRYLAPVPKDEAGDAALYEVMGQSVADALSAEAAKALAAVLAEQGIALADAPLIVRPYPGSRDAALRLAQSPRTWWHGFMWAAGLLICAAIWQAGKGELPRPDHARLYAAERRTWSARHRAGAPVPSHFAPLSSQDEVDEVAKPAAGGLRQALGALLGRRPPASELHADPGQS